MQLAARGIHTSTHVAAYSSAMIGDIMLGKITAGVANAAASHVRNLLKVTEMRERYGTKRDPDDPQSGKILRLA